MGVEYGRRVREGIEIREPVAGGVRSPVTTNGRRPADVAPAGGARRRRANPLLAPGPSDPPAAQSSSQPDAGAAPSRPRAVPKRRAGRDGSAEPRRKPASGGRTGTDQAKESQPRAPDQTSSHGVVCTVGMCPICAMVTAMGEVRPELTEHLLLAGRELLLAMKSLIDARVQPGGDASGGSGGLQRINIE